MAAPPFERQRAYVIGAGTDAAQTIALGLPPQPGNTLILALLGQPNDSAPAGFGLVGYADGGARSLIVWTRPVQTGDGTSYPFSGSANADNAAVLIEVGPGINPVLVAGDQVYTSGPNTLSAGSIATSGSAYVYAFFAIALTATAYVPGATALSGGFTLDREAVSQATAQGSTFVFGHQAAAAPGALGTVVTLPSLAIASGPQLAALLSLVSVAGITAALAAQMALGSLAAHLIIDGGRTEAAAAIGVQPNGFVQFGTLVYYCVEYTTYTPAEVLAWMTTPLADSAMTINVSSGLSAATKFHLRSISAADIAMGNADAPPVIF